MILNESMRPQDLSTEANPYIARMIYIDYSHTWNEYLTWAERGTVEAQR